MRQKPVKPLILTALIFACSLTMPIVTRAQAQSALNTENQITVDQPSEQAAKQEGKMTYDEILALFEREARAAYRMNQAACQTLQANDKTICLAKARLQYDEDRRYAKMRAELGH